LCRKVLSIDDYSSYFREIDPLSPFKKWKVGQSNCENLMSEKMKPPYDVYSERVKGVFVVSDPVDWGRDLQVIPCLCYTNVKYWFIFFNIPGNDNCMSCRHPLL
jgi:hypothetical protein